MNRIFLFVFFISAICCGCAVNDPVIIPLDVDFDGCEDQLIPEKSSDNVTVYHVKRYDVKSGKYKSDAIFSEYLTGCANLFAGTPQVNVKERSIQTFFGNAKGMQRGYKYFVRNGKLCFYDGGELPEAVDFSAPFSAEAVEFDRRAAKFEYDQAVKDWQAVQAELAKWKIISSGAAFAEEYNRDLLPERAEELQKCVAVLHDAIPANFYLERDNFQLYRDFLQQNRENIAKLDAMLPEFARFRKKIDPRENPFKVIFNPQLVMHAARIYRLKMFDAACRGDFAALTAAYRQAAMLIVPASETLHFGVNLSVVTRCGEDLLDSLYMISQKREITAAEWAEVKALFAPWKTFFMKEYLNVLRNEAAIFFWTADILQAGHDRLNREKHGTVLFLNAKEYVREKVIAANYFCKLLAAAEKDPVLSENYLDFIYYEDDQLMLEAFINRENLVKIGQHALAVNIALEAALELAASGRESSAVNPVSGRELLFDYDELEKLPAWQGYVVSIHSFYRKDRGIRINFFWRDKENRIKPAE